MSAPYDLTCRLAFLGHETEQKFLRAVSGQIAASLNRVFSTTQSQEYRTFAPDYCVLYPATASNALISELVAQAGKCSSSPKIILLLLKQNISKLEEELAQQGTPVQVIQIEKPNEYRAAQLLISFFMLADQIKPPDEDWEFIGKSPLIHEIHNLVDRFARFSKDPVLITGETGTGKELIAKRLHAIARQLNVIGPEGEFRPYNAAELPLELCISLLCGSAKGTYTDAIDRKGHIMEAGDGTLFIDEIGELQPAIQVMLLRILQERKVVRLGDDVSKAQDTYARFVFATNRDLKEARHSGAFREDLFQRISALQISVPPLRERLVDIPLLVKHFVKEFVDDYPEEDRNADNVLNVGVLFDYEWPGNVRELRNVVRRAAALTTEGAIEKKLAELVEDKMRERAADALQSSQSDGNQHNRDSYLFLKSLLNDTMENATDRFKQAYEQNLFLRTIGDHKTIKFLGKVEHTKASNIISRFTRLQFKKDDLIDAASLITQIKQQIDPVSKYIQTQLQPHTLNMLNRYRGGELDSSLLEAMIFELNRQLTDEGLPQAESMHDADLSDEARLLIKRFGWKTDLFKLNRLILEDTYGGAITRCALSVDEPPPKTKKTKPTNTETTDNDD